MEIRDMKPSMENEDEGPHQMLQRAKTRYAQNK